MTEHIGPDKLPTADTAGLSPLKRAYLALEQAHARIAELEKATAEPIAVIGLGCRVPGASDPSEFWRLLCDGVDAITEIPGDRFDIDALYNPNPDAPGGVATRYGGFVRDVDKFDCNFFGIAPREAQGMDPQQRLLLEVVWEALEHAGQAPDRLERSATGVYIGAASNDYPYLEIKSGDSALLDAHYASGVAHSVLSGRVSYLLGLQGPSLTLDTACSSSLVAVHLACQGLRNRECRMAIAGGVNLMLGPELFVALSHTHMLAPDGRCKTFAAAADGFSRGEGCGVVVLKRLADAEADGDRILALIRSSAVNQDGPSSGLTAPNGPAQEAVIREALARARIKPREVGYIEAHGTGTQLGDPLEMQALGAVFARDRAANQPLVVGSVKTNIGHLEAAAGVSGLIKLVLALRNRQIPAHLHFDTPNPKIQWAELPFTIPTQSTPWTAIDGRRIGAVSSFGFSGTNAHVVVEEAPATAVAKSPPGRRPHLLTLSAKDERGLAELAERYVVSLAKRKDEELADICHTANTGRAHFAWRATVVAHSIDELSTCLAALARGDDAPGLRKARVETRDPPRFAFLFTGQGAQYAEMARGLYDVFPVFRAALDRCAELLDSHMARSLHDVLFSADGKQLIDNTAFAQPALFAVEYALTELWRSFGVTPSIVAGHSVGEYVAATVAGALTLQDGLRLVARRGALMASLPAGGAMAAITAPEEQVVAAVAPYSDRAAIAAVNGPSQTVISGAAPAIDAICVQLSGQGVRCQPLRVSHAFHSPLMDPILDRFESEVAAVKFAEPQLRLASNLTGRLAAAGEMQRPAYWRRHLREAVRFADNLRALAGLKPDCVIEIGPHPALLAFAGAVWGADAPTLVTSLRKGRDDHEQLFEAVSTLYLAGADIDWRGVESGLTCTVADLPTYPFRRERFWFKAERNDRPAENRPRPGHRLLGGRLRSAGVDTIFESYLTADAPSFIRQHRVLGRVLLPGAAFLEMLAAAAAQFSHRDTICIEDVAISEAMLFDDSGEGLLVQTVCNPAEAGAIPVSVNSVSHAAGESGPWLRHLTGKLRIEGLPPRGSADLNAARARCREPLSPADLYGSFQRRGIDLGDGFRVISNLARGQSEACGQIVLGADLAREVSSYRIHPVLLDGCLQVIGAALTDHENPETLYLPVGIARLTLHRRPGAHCWCHVVVRSGTGDLRRVDMKIFDADGGLVGEMDDVQLKRLTHGLLGRPGGRLLDQCLWQTDWKIAPVTTSPIAATWDLVALSKVGADATAPLKSAAGINGYDVFLRELESLCADFVIDTMLRLGWTPARGEHVKQDQFISQLGIVERHHRLFARLLEILAETGWLARDGQGWRVERAFVARSADRTFERLKQECPQQALAELELTGRVAKDLAVVLRGQCDPMELLFPRGSLAAMEKIYRESPSALFFNGLLTELIVAAAQASALGRPLRILEVGGGTGGTTAHLIPRLPPGKVEYVFTDVGPSFVASARNQFGQHPFIAFEILDLERDPEAQGFSGEQFDIVVASNVVHATSNVRSTLVRLRRLLKPGGLLAMLEVTAPQRWFDLTVGLTPGWWAFNDADLRSNYPTMPRDRWIRVLPECGFDDVAALPEDADKGCLALQSLLLARAAVGKQSQTSRDWLLFADQSGVASELADRLRKRGDRCTLVRPGSFAVGPEVASINRRSAEDYRRLLAGLRSLGRSIDNVVHAWSIDCPRWDELSSTDLSMAEDLGAVSGMLLAQALVNESPTPRLWLLTRGAQQADAHDDLLSPAQAPVWGLAKTLALEHPELRCVCVDLAPRRMPAEVDVVLAEFAEPGAEQQIALRESGRRVARLGRAQSASHGMSSDEAWRLVPGSPGALDELVRQSMSRRPPRAGEVEIAVESTGLNFKDVLNVLGLYPGNAGPLGGECAGRITAVGSAVTNLSVGDEVLAVAAGSFASHVTARAELVQRRPSNVSAEEASSFPIAFLTAEYCLSHLANVRAGDRVLIHAAAGGVGMAAIQIAQRAGAEVVATAGSPQKRELLRSIGVKHVFDSRSAAFADEILGLTSGRGVDVVLNSLSGEQLDASFRVLADHGRFVEIGKRGIKDPEWVTAQNRGLSYFIVDWGETSEKEPQLIGEMLARLVSKLGSGALVPLPRHVFPLDDVNRTFRLMAQARHIGKIVVRHGQPSATFNVRSDGTYLITGGLSGLGLLTAQSLAARGAGKLVLVGRSGASPAAIETVDSIRQSGTSVLVEALDISDETALESLLQQIRRDGPPLRGVIHSAGALDDAGLIQQDADRFARVFAPKVRGSWLLDRLTRADPLDWFVMFSSVAAVLGSAGQANHAAANSFLDLLARERRLKGLPGLSINWGPWTEIGAAAQRELSERLAPRGLGAISPSEGLSALGRLAGDCFAQVAVLPADWQRYSASLPEQARTFLADVVEAPKSPSPSRSSSEPAAETNIRDLLAAAPEARKPAIVAKFVRERALRVLGLDSTRSIDPRVPLGELGLDSLLSVELRNALGSAVGVSLPATLLFDCPTIDAVTDYLLKNVFLSADEPRFAEAVTDAPHVSLLDSIEALPDAEIDRILSARDQEQAR